MTFPSLFVFEALIFKALDFPIIFVLPKFQSRNKNYIIFEIIFKNFKF